VWTESYDTTHRFNTNNWVRQHKTAFTGSGPLYGISFGTADTGIVVGTAGKAWRTTNGGDTWTPVVSTGVPTTADLNAVVMTDANWGWAVASNGLVTRTDDSGATWVAQSLGTTSLEDIATLGGGSRVAIAVGAQGRIMRTTNGTAWLQAGEATIPTGTITINSGAMYTNSINVSVGHTVDWKSGGAGDMRHSTNGGANWTEWEPYSVSKALTLPGGDGPKSVRVQVRVGQGVLPGRLKPVAVRISRTIVPNEELTYARHVFRAVMPPRHCHA